VKTGTQNAARQAGVIFVERPRGEAEEGEARLSRPPRLCAGLKLVSGRPQSEAVVCCVGVSTVYESGDVKCPSAGKRSISTSTF